MSVARTIRNIWRVGIKDYFWQIHYLNDVKSGTFVGADQFGNKYYENLNPTEETPGRHRWVIYAQKDYHASQVPPEWHSWIHHIRKDSPAVDPIMIKSKQAWQQPWTENLTGTRGAYKPYNTAGPKLLAWEPKVASRS